MVAPLPVLAQESQRASEPDFAEASAGIIVTAERRKTRLQDTPLAISVVSGTDLAAQQLSTARDLAGRIPIVIIPRTFLSQSAQSFFIRGLGENDPTAYPAVGVYVDDIYIPRLYGVLADFGDAERMEVLRGPQGTFYSWQGSGDWKRSVSECLLRQCAQYAASAIADADVHERIHQISDCGPLLDLRHYSDEHF